MMGWFKEHLKKASKKNNLLEFPDDESILSLVDDMKADIY